MRRIMSLASAAALLSVMLATSVARADIGNHSPGAHTVRVKAVDSEGRAGGYIWKFTVV